MKHSFFEVSRMEVFLAEKRLFLDKGMMAWTRFNDFQKTSKRPLTNPKNIVAGSMIPEKAQHSFPNRERWGGGEGSKTVWSFPKNQSSF